MSFQPDREMIGGTERDRMECGGLSLLQKQDNNFGEVVVGADPISHFIFKN